MQICLFCTGSDFTFYCFVFRLDKRLILKISDFGLSRDIQDKEYYKIQDTSAELPVRWMSPESLKEFIFTTKGDVVQDVLLSVFLILG